MTPGAVIDIDERKGRVDDKCQLSACGAEDNPTGAGGSPRALHRRRVDRDHIQLTGLGEEESLRRGLRMLVVGKKSTAMRALLGRNDTVLLTNRHSGGRVDHSQDAGASTRVHHEPGSFDVHPPHMARIPDAKLVDPGDVKHPAHAVDQRAKAVVVEHVTRNRGGPDRRKSCGGARRTSEGIHFVPGLNEVIDEGGPDNARAARDGDLHVLTSVGSERTVCQNADMYPQAEPTVAITAMSIAH